MKTQTLRLISISVLLALPLTASALIMTGRGNDPVRDVGWPEGALTLANLESRVGWWEGPPFGGGQWTFLYRGDTETFEKALTAFAAIRTPTPELVLHDGPKHDTLFRDDDESEDGSRVDWTFTVWVPANWHHLYNNPKSTFGAGQPQFREPVDPPRLDVYIGGGGSIDWAKVKVPDTIRVRDERASAARVIPVNGALVRVEAFDMANAKPVPRAQLIVETRVDPKNSRAVYKTIAEAVGEDDGRVEVQGIPAGTHRLSVEAAGYAPRLLDLAKFEEHTFKEYTVELSKSANVSGKVTDTAGKPVPNVKVRPSTVLAIDGRGYTLPGGAQAVTDMNGSFTLTNLPNGFMQFRIREPGYYFSDLFTIHDVPGTNVALRVTRAGSVRVTVTDATGKPMSHFEGKPLIVEVEPVGGNEPGTWGGSATVKDDGTIEFENIQPGEYRFNSRPNPANTQREYTPEKLIQITPGKPAQVTMVYE